MMMQHCCGENARESLLSSLSRAKKWQQVTGKKQGVEANLEVCHR